MFENFVHPFGLHVEGDEGRKVNERLGKRVIKTRDGEQKRKKREHGQSSLGEQNAADKGHRDNSEPQNHLCRNHKSRQAEFAYESSAFHSFDFRVQSLHICFLSVIRP